MPNVIPKSFATMTLEDAKMVIQVAVRSLASKVNVLPLDRGVNVPDYYLNNPILIGRAFVLGDHWQNGLGWIGPRPQNTDPAYSETMAEIARQFVSKNVIGEIVARHVSGVVGIEPHFGFAPLVDLPEDAQIPEALQKKIDEAEALLTKWWNERRMHEIMQRVAAKLLYAERGMIRLYVPRGMLVDREVADPANPRKKLKVKAIVATDVADALSKIWPDDPEPDIGTVALDDDTKQYVGVVVYKLGSNVEGLQGNEERAEIVYVNDAKQTVMRSVGNNNINIQITFDFGGRLPMYEAKRDLLITPQMWQGQRGLNLALSMTPRGVVTSGFLERTIFNAQMPGKWEGTAENPKAKFVPDPIQYGAGVTNSFVGLQVVDESTGKTSYTTPRMDYREPVSLSPVIEAKNSHYLDLLEEGGQEHVMAVRNAQASGKTHEQARADFKMTLSISQARIEPMGRWLLETLFVMAEAFVGSDRPYTSELRAYFDCQLDTGPITAAERAQNDASYAAGTCSLQTTLVRNGATDPDTEMQLIATQPGGRIAIAAKQSAIVQEMTTAGAALRGALVFAGVDAALIDGLVGDGTPPTNTPPALPPGKKKKKPAAKKPTAKKRVTPPAPAAS